MASDSAAAFVLPKVPVPHKDFVSLMNGKPRHEIPDVVAPYNQYEAKLREGFAQHRDHDALQDPTINAVPIFRGDKRTLRVRARGTDDQSLNEKYIMPLNAKDRKPEGALATVESMQDFKKNFNIFSESSLADFDWNNVVAAGSSVVTALLPVPDQYNTSKKALREYYHQKLAPSSDVDLFIWGLDEGAALEKIKQIESCIRNAILEEVTTVRTKNAITIASHYPIRHVQIVLRLYKSVSEILSGFDVDCSCFAYDGNQVYGTPRAITAFVTQTNTIDLSRRSPSYESRLSKYARRGFEVYWPALDRSRIDPTIFERSFSRTMGLARLLVLEQLPKPSDREQYLIQRREERGRPSQSRYWSRQNALPNNVKDQDPDDIAEWVYEDDVSNYHSFTVPYGPKYHSKKIEKLLYTKDLLLNAEWNRKKDRTVNLHRHPCFIGPIENVIHDCCGFCPQPVTEEEREVADEESKIYVYGELAFMKDDPGRQTIGSFHPLTNDDWTDMAYIGNTEELCQKIRNGDLDFIRLWCEQHHESIDRRDHTGRTPLHLAAHCSTPEILECLVGHGARIVARLVDGMTALHIAAARGSVEMVTTLLEKSEENEAAEDERQEQEQRIKRGEHSTTQESAKFDDHEDEDSDEDMDDAGSDEDTAMTEGSFVKVGDRNAANEDVLDNANDTEPDIYDVNVVAWDTPVSALHLAILGGHIEVIKLLVSTFGADVLLPVKLVDSYTRSPRAAIMTLILAARLPGSSPLQVTKELLALGASSAQGDMEHITAFHYLVAEQKVELLKACLEEDGAACRTALDHTIIQSADWRPRSETPLTTAIKSADSDIAAALIDFGAKPFIALDDFVAIYSVEKECSTSSWWRDRDEDVAGIWRQHTKQPVFLAVAHDMPDLVSRMLDAGADINTLDRDAHQAITRYEDGHSEHRVHGASLLDAVNAKISTLENALDYQPDLPEPIALEDEQVYLKGTDPGSYERWYISKTIEVAKHVAQKWEGVRVGKLKEEEDRQGKQQRFDALRTLQKRFVALQDQLLRQGAETVRALHPNIPFSHGSKGKPSKKQDKPFEPRVEFRSARTDKLWGGYLQLFESAWKGDADQVKRLTLTNWGPEQTNTPLMVTVQDGKGFTPLAIAIYRRHFELAKTILEIADVQFKGSADESTKLRYTVDDSDNDAELSEDDENELRISSRVVDETYTIDNIAALKQSVGSKVSATELLNKNAEIWGLLNLSYEQAHEKLGSANDSVVEDEVKEGETSSDVFRRILSREGYRSRTLGRYAIVSRDLDMLRFWLRCCKEASKMRSKSDVSAFCGFDTADFQFALRHGFIEELGEMIRIAGAELPLDALVKRSGVQEDLKPKYYQGLSIGGKKMTAWARKRGGDSYQQALGESTPPLLQAAHQVGLAATEWALSDTPFRLYREYGANNTEDPRLKTLAKAHGGLDQAISSWLKQRSIATTFPTRYGSTNNVQGNLSLHAAVLSLADDDKSLAVLKYLLSVFPASIESPSVSHPLTPLALSFLTGRIRTAEVLLSAGADQTTRDSNGKNLVHLSLIAVSKSPKTDVSKFRTLLALIDKRLFPSLFKERCRDSPGGLTPLAYWLASIDTSFWSSLDAKLVPEILSVMLEFGGEDALSMMDGSGQFPLHQAVKLSYTGLVQLMLAHDPALLAQENAMGQTPLELAESLYFRDCTKGNPDIKSSNYKPLEERKCEEFVRDERDGGEGNITRHTWKICRDCARDNPRERKLISVNEAREVAKRLAERNKAEREKQEEAEKGEGEEDVKKDEVDAWLGGSDAVRMGNSSRAWTSPSYGGSEQWL